MLEGLQLLRESGFDRAVAWCLSKVELEVPPAEVSHLCP